MLHEKYPVRPLFDVQSVRDLERQLFEQQNSYDVMQQAANALSKHIDRRWPNARRFAIMTGGGNNGGDGFLLAILLQEADCEVTVLDCATRARQGDALKAYEAAMANDVKCLPFENGIKDFDAISLDGLVLVDALLGIGAKLPLSAMANEVVRWVNGAKSHGAYVVCVDMPTGIDSDTGYAIGGEYIIADLTVSMVQLKLGNVLGKGGIACGELVNTPLGSGGLPLVPTMSWLDADCLAVSLPCPRAKDSHKGTFGHVIVVGGDVGFGGAAIMASEASSKAGAGTVALLTRSDHIAASLTRNPNVMALSCDADQAESLVVRDNSVIVLGPGLGRSTWGKACFEYWVSIAKKCSYPLVLDADALFWLSQLGDVTLPECCVITPHVGEAARLLGWSIDEIQRDLMRACLALSKRYQCVAVLKGTSTIVANAAGEVYVTGRAAPVMAKGGSGDVLSGILGACLAYYKTPVVASVLAVAWHNYAAILSALALGEHRAQPYDVLNYLD